MTIVIKIENLSKQYRLGLVSTRTLSHDLNRWWHMSIKGKEDPYIKIGEAGREQQNGYIWALKDINLEVQEGEVLGIIGKNGAGKSTLLKILSKVTAPTAGTVRARGRIASLLEVGTGFHPEMTGRENIYINGAVMGMTKSEITKKFDEIVDFAGVDRYIDTPVKRYSSGMIVRLGFAVAAHLEPEILVVDEVLAVGDAEFQKKAIGKMQNISKGEGRTVLFVSHNMTAVKNLCKYGIILENGSVKHSGDITDIVNKYLNETSEKGICNNYWKLDNAPGTDKIKVKSAYIKFNDDNITVKTPFNIVTEFWNLENGFEINVSMHLLDIDNTVVFAISTENIPLTIGLHKAVFQIPANLMNDGFYSVSNLFVTNSQEHFFHTNANSFEIFENRIQSEWHGKWPGNIRPTFIKSEIL